MVKASTTPMTKAVWVIEDNPDHVVLISSQLETLPAIGPIRVTRDGEQALRAIETCSATPGFELPGMVLLDLQLPKVRGTEVLRALRASATWQHVPVVVLSTSAAPSDIEACYSSGANAYLTKGMHLPDLAARVSEFVTRWPRR